MIDPDVASNVRSRRAGDVACQKEGRKNMRLWVQLLTGAMLAVAVPAANAQEQKQSPAPSPSQPKQAVPDQKQAIPDQKLDAAAAALDQISSVKENYQQQIEKSAEPAEKQRLVDEANKAMVKAVTDQGLSVEEYTAILVMAQSDSGVRQKILDRLRPSNKQ
jgi:FtsZ-interacting cell division protein ZipA